MSDAQRWDTRYRQTELLWGDGPNRHFADAVGDLAPGRALDLGCGEGRNAIWLAERGWTVTAVDFSAVALDRASRLADKRGVTMAFEQRDVRRWTPPAQAFDLVAVIYLQLPSDDLASVHGLAADAVATGGTLIVLGHDRRNLAEGHGGPPDPDLLLDPETVAGEVRGLRVVTAETITRTIDDDRTALDTYVRAERPTDPR